MHDYDDGSVGCRYSIVFIAGITPTNYSVSYIVKN